jgi:type I restriction enzyme S subunit
MKVKWPLTRVAEICERVSVGIVIEPSKYYTSKFGVRAFRSQNVRENRVNNSNWVYLTEDGDRKNSKSKLRTNDVLIVRSGAPGVACVLPPNYAGSNCIDLVFARPRQDLVDSRFLCSFFNSSYGRSQALGMQNGLAQKHLNVGSVAEMLVPLPPLPEQQKIADILGTWDEALEKLDALIAAKTRRKQALMQQLLTGQRRLPGFGAPWRWLPLDEVCERVDRKAPAGVARVLSITAGVGFQDQREKFSRVIAGRNIENYIHLKRGEFSYNKGNSNLYPQGCVYRLEEYDDGAVPNVWVSFALKSKEMESDFLKQYFLAGGHNHQLSRLINYGVRNDGLLNLTADKFFSIKVPVPPPKEQQRLGKLFESLSGELRILRDQRAALDQQKRGLMQQLLTGKARVSV